MRLIENIGDLRVNMKTLDDYLNRKVEPEYTYALEKIKHGICFVVDSSYEIVRFYPSRFIGYKNNTYDLHETNLEKDGRDTNKQINNVLGELRLFTVEIEKWYNQYCESLGFVPQIKGDFGNDRKYWLLN